jgi:CRISPR-associated protein Cas1
MTSLPIESIENILLFGGVNITTPCTHELLKRGIHITWLSKNGSFYGRLESTEHININRQRLQFRKSDDENFRLELSKKFITGKTLNQKTILMRYYRRNDNNFLRESINGININIRNIEKSNNIAQLMGTEGTIAKYYYKGINSIIKNEFKFNGRSKRPPKDAFNSILSFGYTLLLYEIFTNVITKGLNPYAAFMHKDKHRHPALCSDLMEEWRPILVDSLAISLLNSFKITKENFDYNNYNGGVYLNIDGIKIFVMYFEQRLREEVKYIVEVDHKMSFRRILEYQVMQLVKSLENDCGSYYKPVLIR